VAAQLKADLSVETEIAEGYRGEFSVWVDSTKVAEKTRNGFPSDDQIVESVRKRLSSANNQ
jgi:hypothetical protein